MIAHVFVLLLVVFGAPQGSNTIVPAAVSQPYPTKEDCLADLQVLKQKLNDGSAAGVLVGATGICVPVDVRLVGLPSGKQEGPSL